MKPFAFFAATTATLLALGAAPFARAVDCPDPGGQCPRPVQLGVSGMNVNAGCSAGTLGALLNLGGTRVILSNNHVLARENAGAVGRDAIVQPGTLDNVPGCATEASDVVGILAHFIPIVFSGGSNIFDMAFAGTNANLVDASGDIAGIGLVSTAPFPGVPPIGTLVKKHGRTTGLTYGQISAVNVTSNITYDTGSAVFRHQYRVTPGRFSDPGDSGSLIVEDVATCARAVGLLFAGNSNSTLANPLNLFLTFTGFNIVGDSTCPPAAAIARAPAAAMNRAMAAQSLHEPRMLATPGVVGMGVGRDDASGAPVVEIYVESAADAARQAMPRALEGVPARVVVTGAFVAY